MTQTQNAAPSGKSNGTATDLTTTVQSTPDQGVYTPLCYQGIGIGPCGNQARCLDRKQPMCGGYGPIEANNSAAILFELDGAIRAAEERETERASCWVDLDPYLAEWELGNADA